MTRRLRRRPSARGWTDSQKCQLRHGHDFFGSGWGDPTDIPLEDREGWPSTDVEADMREAWEHFRNELMDESKDTLRRPWAWWRFDCEHEPDQLGIDWEGEDFHDHEAAVLDYLNLLTPAALSAAAKDASITRGILNEFVEHVFRRRWGWWRFTSPERRDYSKPQASQLVELEKRGAEVLTDRERYILKQKADDSTFKNSACARIWLTPAECDALGLDKAQFVLDYDK